MLYSEKVMDHFQNPRNVGALENADASGEVGNVQCGDIMKIYIKVEDDVITDITFETFGCGSAIASSSITTEMVKGKTIKEALELSNREVVEELGGLPNSKVHCSVLAEDALKVAIYNYAEKNGKTYKGLKDFNPSKVNHEH
ncbi:MAG: Fe-S cluster assembly scaffold protein NifU [Bacillota bacterium]